MRQLHNVHCKFDSVLVLRAKLVEIFGYQIPNNLTFDVGYYEGSQHSKMWLCSKDDLEAMYSKYPRGEITLWCYNNCEDDVVCNGKRKKEDCCSVSSKRQKREDSVDIEFEKLKARHGSSYDSLKLRLWARMIVQGVHKDYDSPPQIPAFGSPPQLHKESVSSAISGAAMAITKALSGTPPKKDGSDRQAGISPGKAIELRMKNYEQLRYIQQLYDDGILSETEYTEQKRGILDSLKRL